MTWQAGGTTKIASLSPSFHSNYRSVGWCHWYPDKAFPLPTPRSVLNQSVNSFSHHTPLISIHTPTITFQKFHLWAHDALGGIWISAITAGQAGNREVSREQIGYVYTPVMVSFLGLLMVTNIPLWHMYHRFTTTDVRPSGSCPPLLIRLHLPAPHPAIDPSVDYSWGDYHMPTVPSPTKAPH